MEKEQAKTEVKVEAKAEAKPAIKKKYNPPVVGEPKMAGIMEGLTGANEQVAILSYLPYRPLVNVTKSSRYAYKFIMERPTRKRILCWKPDKDEETKLGNYINGVIQKMAAAKAAAAPAAAPAAVPAS